MMFYRNSLTTGVSTDLQRSNLYVASSHSSLFCKQKSSITQRWIMAALLGSGGRAVQASPCVTVSSLYQWCLGRPMWNSKGTLKQCKKSYLGLVWNSFAGDEVEVGKQQRRRGVTKPAKREKAWTLIQKKKIELFLGFKCCQWGHAVKCSWSKS